MCMYVCEYMYMYMYVYVCMYMYEDVCIYIFVSMHLWGASIHQSIAQYMFTHYAYIFPFCGLISHHHHRHRRCRRCSVWEVQKGDTVTMSDSSIFNSLLSDNGQTLSLEMPDTQRKAIA